MSTVTKIETAIKQLPAQKVEGLAAWLDEYRQTLHASVAQSIRLRRRATGWILNID